MKKLYYLLFFSALATLLSAQSGALDKERVAVIKALDGKAKEYGDLAHQIWTYAEVGYQEYKSTKALQDKLSAEGFSVKAGVADIPTSFLATFGEGKPVIGFLAEFDALPGVSQDAVPYKKEREEVKAGHACGHHLFGSASVAAAIAVKNWMQQTGQKGTVRVYGTPAEEGGSGKVYMVRAGLFEDVDAVIHWHPGNSNSASASSSLANKSAKFRFYGAASHAAGAPEKGRSALDGVEALNYMANMMREHVPAETRIHYVITRGGEAPNVVPAYAEVYYYVRHPEMKEVKSIFDRLVKAAEGAALGTETRMEYEIIGGVYNLLPNETLAEIMYKNLKTVGGVSYTEDEKQFALEVMKTLDAGKLTPESAQEIKPYTVQLRGSGGSTDVGDVSWMAPTVGMSAATWAPGTPAHSWQAVAVGGMSIGRKGMMVAAKSMALMAMDLFQSPATLEKAKKELLEKRGKDFQYDSMLGTRKPALDYRN